MMSGAVWVRDQLATVGWDIRNLHECDPMTGQVIRSSKQTAIRYERDRPGELVHMDVKKIGTIPDGGGWRARGETAANHQSRLNKAPIRYDYVHSLVDGHSRLAYSEILPDEKGTTCAAFSPGRSTTSLITASPRSSG